MPMIMYVQPSSAQTFGIAIGTMTTLFIPYVAPNKATEEKPLEAKKYFVIPEANLSLKKVYSSAFH